MLASQNFSLEPSPFANTTTEVGCEPRGLARFAAQYALRGVSLRLAGVRHRVHEPNALASDIFSFGKTPPIGRCSGAIRFEP